MSFLKLLQGIGDRLGILESVSGPGGAPAAKIQTRSVPLRVLAGEIRSGEIQALAESPAELTVPFSKIFETAGLAADAREWTVERLKEVVSADPMRSRPREEIRQAVLDRLRAEGVTAEIIVKDAIARDQAMDSYESFVGEKMALRTEAFRKRRTELESRIQDLQEERKRLEAAIRADEEKWRDWKKRKRERERELAALVSYIVDHSVISLEDEDGT